jgi:uncharacterized membrane-anchored protein
MSQDDRSSRQLPADDALRAELHNELHARPPARIQLPAMVISVAVLNEGVTRVEECEHLRRLPGNEALDLERLRGQFLRLRFENHSLKWERHSEFTRYSIAQPPPAAAGLGASDPDLLSALVTPPRWLQEVPGRTVAAILLVMQHAELPALQSEAHQRLMSDAQRWFGEEPIMASQIGGGYAWAFTDLALRETGFEHMLVLAPASTSELRAGRISQRLLELETYRMMALRGLPVAKAMAPSLSAAETQLAAITARIESGCHSERALLDELVNLSASVERATAESVFRFAATRAYESIVWQRQAELREQLITGTPPLGGFVRRRMAPAMATVASTAERLSNLSERVSRASALLRTRVDIVTEAQNQELLEKLTRGQALQLQLQTTVEGLSIAAISYYVVSLILYVLKACKAAGVLPFQPEAGAGAAIPLVLWAVWRTVKRIHARLSRAH